VSKARVLGRIAAVLTMAGAIGIASVGSASAHNVLIASNPPEGATLATVPTSVTFTFDQPVQNFDPVVSLIGPDGRQYATGAPAISGNTVTGAVAAGPAGAYTAAYRVVSADGHPVTGEVHFSLAGDELATARSSPDGGSAPAAPPASAAPASSGISGPAAASTSSDAVLNPSETVARAGRPNSGLSAWLWVGLIAAALVIAVAAVLLLRRPARERGRGNDY